MIYIFISAPLFLFILLYIRTNLIYNIRRKRILEIRDFALEQISKEKCFNFFETFDKYFENVSFDKMFWQLTKWKYDDFYEKLAV